jgi:hypothetical protein
MLTFHKRLEIYKWVKFESNRRIQKISCNFAWVNLIASTKLMTKKSHTCVSLIKFITMLRRGTMQARLRKVPILVKCSKSETIVWIVGLSWKCHLTIMIGIFVIFFECVQLGIDIQEIQTLYFHDLTQLNQFQMPFWKVEKNCIMTTWLPQDD